MFVTTQQTDQPAVPKSLQWLLRRLKAAGIDRQHVSYRYSEDALKLMGIDAVLIKLWSLETWTVTLNGRMQVPFSSSTEPGGIISFTINCDVGP